MLLIIDQTEHIQVLKNYKVLLNEENVHQESIVKMDK